MAGMKRNHCIGTCHAYTYNAGGILVRIQFTNGSVTKRQEICEMRPRPALHGMPKGGQVVLQFK